MENNLYTFAVFYYDAVFQELLEKANIPFVGTQSSKCRTAFDKVTFSFLETHLPNCLNFESFVSQDYSNCSCTIY